VDRPIGHVLVVDDDPLNRRLLTTSLERDGHRTTSADDGLVALEAIREDEPDVVLLDLVMPGLDGIAVLDRMKADPDLRHVPVIVISSVEETDSIVRCIAMGAEDFLPKPFDPVILRARVSAGLNRKAVHDMERERVRNVFARFLPEPLVDRVLAKSEGEPSIEPEQLVATVMFADLRAFTRFGEGRGVDDVIAALNRYHELMTDAILDNGGTLIDRMGDGIMAAFGAPIADEKHADRALAAAREMSGPKLDAFNAWLLGRGVGEPFRMGIGLNSGAVMSGSVGSSRRLDYTVIGDTTNTASRIETLTKELPFPVLVSEETYRSLVDRAPDDLVFVDEVEIRGRRSAVRLWGLGPAVRAEAG
jgi:adenylate cyclase